MLPLLSVSRVVLVLHTYFTSQPPIPLPCLFESKTFSIHTSLQFKRGEQRKASLRNTWPSVSVSLFGSGFFLGTLVDGLHSRVNLVEYQYGSIDIGPLHTNIWEWKKSFWYCSIGVCFKMILITCFFTWIFNDGIGSSFAWTVLLRCWVSVTFFGWKGIIYKDSRRKRGECSCYTSVSI